MELRVSLAGGVAVQADGVVIAEDRFPGRQGRLLFAYLVLEQARPVPRDELAEVLWGEAPPTTWDKALTVLASITQERGVSLDPRTHNRVVAGRTRSQPVRSSAKRLLQPLIPGRSRS